MLSHPERLLSRPKVLVVDDDPTSLELVAGILEPEDYDLVFATTGADALQLAAGQPDLVLLDHHLPDINGLEVCRRLKLHPSARHTQVIMVTANSDPNLEVQGLEVGAADFVTKPFSAAVLRARVRNSILLKQQRSLLARSERQARAFLNTAMDAVVVIDGDSRILELNAAGANMFGYTAQEALGQPVSMLMPVDVAAQHTGYVAQAHFNSLDLLSIRGGVRGGAMPVLGRTKQGHVFPVEVSMGSAGTTDEMLFVGVIRDITDRRRQEHEVAQSRQRELDISAAIQRQLLFGAPPTQIAGFDIALFNHPSQGVDGDFHIFTQLGSDRFEILTGDVMGKGVAAALMGAAVINSYRLAMTELSYQQQGGEPPSPAAIVNAIHRYMGEQLMALDAFVTLVLLRFDTVQQTLTWVNAGHTPSLLSLAQGGETRSFLGDNLPVGILPSEIYQEHTEPFHPGDTLMLYSDGVSESANPLRGLFGDDRVIGILEDGQRQRLAPSKILAHLQQALSEHRQGAVQNDDMTAIVVQRKPVPQICTLDTTADGALL